jgi:hypothetical protein
MKRTTSKQIKMESIETIGSIIKIGVYCLDQDHYNELPMSVSYNGKTCKKMAYNHHSMRCFYQTGLIVEDYMETSANDPLINLSQEEMIRCGYLVIERRGSSTSYLPTQKYQMAMKQPHQDKGFLVETEEGAYLINGLDIQKLDAPRPTPLLMPHYEEQADPFPIQ